MIIAPGTEQHDSLNTPIKQEPSQKQISKATLKQKKSKLILCKIRLFKLIIILLIILVALIVGFFVVKPYINYTKQNMEANEEVVEETKFKRVLLDVIDNISTENNQQYALDENYYNEEDVITYISIMSDCSEDCITSENVEEVFWEIFIPIKKEGIVQLIKKDNETLIMECEDKKKMNLLDHAFMGLTNEEIIKASRGVYISQNNDEFEKIPYGTANLKTSGCGPIALTMAINYVYGMNMVSLDDVLKWAEENNMYEENSGTKWSLIRNFPRMVSVNCKEMYIGNYEKFKTSLSEGEVFITSMNDGHFTDKGHFIVITEIKDDFISVLDSASICRSLNKWDAKLVFEESNKYFWKISKKEE